MALAAAGRAGLAFLQSALLNWPPTLKAAVATSALTVGESIIQGHVCPPLQPHKHPEV